MMLTKIRRTRTMNENEELTSSCATSEPSFYNASYHPTENTSNVHCATLMHDETYVNVLTFSTNHAIVEHFIVEPSLDLSLTHDDLLDVSYDKGDLADNASVVHVLNSHTCAELNMSFILPTRPMSVNCGVLYILWVTLI
jgi:hypothetical protein